MYMKKGFLYGFVFLLPIVGLAQNLTLPNAINIALQNSLGLQISKNYVAIAGINNNYATAGGLPVVIGSATNTEQSVSLVQEYANAANNKTSSNVGSNGLSAGVTGSMILFNNGRVVTAKKRLGVIEDQTKLQLNARQVSIVYNVMVKYYDVVRQQGYAKTLEQSIVVSKQKQDIVKAQQSVGLANNTDFFQSEVDLNTQLLNLQAQQLIIDQDKTDLLTLLTLKPDSAISINDTILVDKGIDYGAIKASISSNPDIKVAYDQIVINQYLVKEIGTQRYPALGVSGGYNFMRTQSAAGFTLLNQNYGPFIGVNFSIPIFNGGIYKKQEQVAGINVNTARLQKDTLVLGYTSIVVKNWQAYQNNLKQLSTAQKNYQISQQLLSLVLQRFQLHQSTIVDVKNAQQSFENAGYLLINISYAAKVAEIQLKRFANQLTY